MIFLSLFLGAALYIVIQVLWYSPWGFGHLWLATRHSSAAEAIRDAERANFWPEALTGIVFPACLMSMALHALYAVLGRFGTVVFFGATLLLYVLTIIKKYRRWPQEERVTRMEWLIHDGVLLVALLTLALFVFFLFPALY